LITARAFQLRAEEAIGGHVGDLGRLRGSIDQPSGSLKILSAG
jgi:hypothetical protein